MLFTLNKNYEESKDLNKNNNQNYCLSQLTFEEKLMINTYQEIFRLQQDLINQLELNKKLILMVQNSISNNTNTSYFNFNVFLNNKIQHKNFQQFSEKQNFCDQNTFSFKNQNVSWNQSTQSSKMKKINKLIKKDTSRSSFYWHDQNSYQKNKNFMKNARQTKHIPKNFGKFILIYMQKNPLILQKLCIMFEEDLQALKKSVINYKNKIFSIKDLKNLWIEKENKFAKIYRIISIYYLRKHCLSHIFNSRVQNLARHIKYKYRIKEGVQDPQNFNMIKEF